MKAPEFSQRELDELDPHYDRMINGANHMERNRILSNTLRFVCDKRGIDLYRYIVYKARQQTEPTEMPLPQTFVTRSNPETDLKDCKRELCDNQFTGRPDKVYCSGRCRQLDFQDKNKK